MTELEPCPNPWCGSTNIEIEESWRAGSLAGPETDFYYVMCQDCGNGGPQARDHQLAIDAWNTRHNEAEELLEWLNVNGGLLMCDELGCLVQAEGVRKERNTPLDALRAAWAASDE